MATDKIITKSSQFRINLLRGAQELLSDKNIFKASTKEVSGSLRKVTGKVKV